MEGTASKVASDVFSRGVTQAPAVQRPSNPLGDPPKRPSSMNIYEIKKAEGGYATGFWDHPHSAWNSRESTVALSHYACRYKTWLSMLKFL